VELEAKEARMVILGLRLLLKQTIDEMATLDEEDDEHVFLSNDAVLIDSMIGGLEAEYETKFGHK